MTFTLKFRRGNAGFRKGFSIFRDGSAVDLIAQTGTLTAIWWHKNKRDPTDKIKITFTGEGDIDGSNNEQLYFDVPTNFYNKVAEWDGDVEIYNDGILIYHSEQSHVVSITEPAGLHTDT